MMVPYQFRRAVEAVIASLVNKILNVGGLNVGTATGAGTGDLKLSGNITPSGGVLTINGAVTLGNSFTSTATNSISFFGAGVAAKQTVTGSRGGNAALASLLTALANYGLITDSTTA